MTHTPHLKERIRVDIGKMLISHEIYKLFPDFGYENIKHQTDRKWRVLNSNEKVRDFWNLIDSLMMGYKLKDIVSLLITSMLIDWDKMFFEVNDIRFTSDITKISGYSIGGLTAKEVSNYLFENPVILASVKKDVAKEYRLATSRANDPIIVEKQLNNSLHAHDGNGRLLKAIIENQNKINVYIGKRNNKIKTNDWVPTSYLQRLAEAGSEDLLIKILNQSDNAVLEFSDRVVIDASFKRRILTKIA